ncbi:hypothetical protein [Paracoccus aestuariivivens]|uniref:Uncharacterized protein n=1 Tax=Paracoccus aestuariivivens TaxID=1820333 RepID=A0A6L6JDU6_9RHOB|nr:hypothetical protein [Paracoccus aestuariivivens]MTH79405.1 hypothetical protein [Paracoccus aestuariivivens]
MNLPALRPRKYRLHGRTITRTEAAAMMGVTEARIDEWVDLGAPMRSVDTRGRAATFDCTELTEWLLNSEQDIRPKRHEGDDLPPSAQEIADVIGRERTLFLIGRLPQSGSRPWRVCLYVPTRIGPDHPLVSLIGWRDANLLVREFGGIILQPSNCRFLHRRWRTTEVRRLHGAGWAVRDIAGMLDISARQVANIVSVKMA